MPKGTKRSWMTANEVSHWMYWTADAWVAFDRDSQSRRCIIGNFAANRKISLETIENLFDDGYLKIDRNGTVKLGRSGVDAIESGLRHDEQRSW